VGAGRLRIAAVSLHLHGVDQVGELDGVLDEEDRDIVADQVPVAFLGIELDRETANIARQIDRTLGACHRREPYESGRALADPLEHIGAADVGQALGQFEEPVRAIAACMDDALGNAFMVEVEHLLAEMEIFEQRRAARALLQAVLIVGNGNTLLSGESSDIAACHLVRFTTGRLGIGIRE
jgi:hypothetical protein